MSNNVEVNHGRVREARPVERGVSRAKRRSRLAARLLAALAAGGALGVAAPARAATYVVTTADDLVTPYPCAGHCSLREALLRANASANRDRIVFNIGGGGAHRITVKSSSSLRATHPVVIDATTQPGFDGKPLIELRGPGAATANTQLSGLMLEPGADGSVISGFVINGFNVAGIAIRSSDNLITGNFIGTNASGMSAFPNSTGISLGAGADGNMIGGIREGDGNVISGNGVDTDFPAAGVGIAGSDNSVLGNLIGVAADGVRPLPNTGPGVRIRGGDAPSRNLIGDIGYGNLIAFNDYAGVVVEEGDQNGVLGNSIFDNGGLDHSSPGIEVERGANADLPAPVVSSAVEMWVIQPPSSLPNAPRFKRVLRVSGTVSEDTPVGALLDFYSNSTCGTGQFGFARGEQYELTRGIGSSNFHVDLPAQDWRAFTVILRTAANDTTEFSNCMEVTRL